MIKPSAPAPPWISIHAPTRGATAALKRKLTKLKISIHAPTRGATSIKPQRSCMTIFQSTLPRGERRDFASILSRTRRISIHAPTRGATLPGNNQRGRRGISIHAPTRGATGHSKYILKDPQDFNPRSHEGSDTARKQPERTAGNFNPRSHEGSDGQHFMQLRGREISIHAPTRGATLEAMASMAKVPKISIHAPTRGATIHTRSARLLHRISIHAPTRGATFILGYMLGIQQISIHAPTRGATSVGAALITIQPVFQSTLPRGERPFTASTT